jgi:hypothetical protein
MRVPHLRFLRVLTVALAFHSHFVHIRTHFCSLFKVSRATPVRCSYGRRGTGEKSRLGARYLLVFLVRGYASVPEALSLRQGRHPARR